MNSREKYNFKLPDNRRKAAYKLVMYLEPGTTFLRTESTDAGDRRKVFFGYYDKPDQGLARLKQLITATRHLKKAEIYYKSVRNSDQFNEKVFEYPEAR